MIIMSYASPQNETYVMSESQSIIHGSYCLTALMVHHYIYVCCLIRYFTANTCPVLGQVSSVPHDQLHFLNKL